MTFADNSSQIFTVLDHKSGN